MAIAFGCVGLIIAQWEESVGCERADETSCGSAAAPTPDERLPLLSALPLLFGSTLRFYEWLEASNRPALPEGPPVWICGDCHVGNLGPVASTDGAIAIQVRDLDQTVIGNPAHDLIRLGLSLAMAARGSEVPGITTRMIEGYEAAFMPEARGERTDSSADMPKTVKLVMRQAAGRSWKHLADERIEGSEPVIPLGKRFWPLSTDERTSVEALFAEGPCESFHRAAVPRGR